jgi:UDP-N-acetylmuramoyl-tripeptide--D-alanyl-D-alanine ligase
MEIIKNSVGVSIINDCYNASYESTKAALEYLSSLNQNRKIAVLGDVLELGEYSKQMHEKIGEEVVKNNVDILITVGTEAKEIAAVAKKAGIEVHSFEKNIQAINELKENMRNEDVILVKASNAMNFIEIVEAIK